MKNAVFWDVAPCIYCVNRRFRGTYRLHIQGRKIRERGTSVSRWLLRNVGSHKNYRPHIPEDGIILRVVLLLNVLHVNRRCKWIELVKYVSFLFVDKWIQTVV
jgi:hypothetical protein